MCYKWRVLLSVRRSIYVTWSVVRAVDARVDNVIGISLLNKNVHVFY